MGSGSEANSVLSGVEIYIRKEMTSRMYEIRFIPFLFFFLSFIR